MEMVIVAKDEDLEEVNQKLQEGWTVKECRPVSCYNFSYESGYSDVYVYFVLQKND